MIKRSVITLIFAASILGPAVCARAEVKVGEIKDYVFSITPYLRTDIVTLKNNVDLDSKNSDDSTTYLGIDYSLAFDLKSKSSGPQLYLKFERNGPYDYDAPLFIHNTLITSTARITRYKSNELLPQLEELWLDLPLGKAPARLKSGLFTYNVGHSFALNGAYENYGFHLYNDSKDFKWGFYYCKPDLVNERWRGPRIKQEKEQGIAYEHAKADFFATDVTFTLGENKIQPYVGILLDRTNAKRTNTIFSTPTHHDDLGTFGLSLDAVIKKLGLEFEVARNFGKAKSSDDAFKDVKHCGYLIYTKADYKFDKLTPHSRFVYGSGNRVTTEMSEVDGVLVSGKNRAFSVYSPLNTTIADSIYPNVEVVPLVAMGGGNGLNYGINRPGTFGDPRLMDNLILLNAGFDYNLTDKLSCALDWWYLRSPERGVGTFGGVYKQLSRDLGNELDASFNYALNNNVSLDLLAGCFFPGNYYKEERDDTAGSLITPFVRGDGEVNSAYQLELSLTVTF